jgi:hypothetical protein
MGGSESSLKPLNLESYAKVERVTSGFVIRHFTIGLSCRYVSMYDQDSYRSPAFGCSGCIMVPSMTPIYVGRLCNYSLHLSMLEHMYGSVSSDMRG